MKAFIAVVLLASIQVQAQILDEIIVTGSYVDGSPIVYTVKGDFYLQPLRLINDSLITAERLRDTRLTFEALFEAAQNNEQIFIIGNEDELAPLESVSSFSDLFTDNHNQNDKSIVDLFLKSPIEKSGQIDYARRNQSFLDGVQTFGRTKIYLDEDSEITILNPRQYRPALISAIGKDINHINQAFGGDYRVVLTGLDKNIDWFRSGIDSVSFYLDYSFAVIPKNITMYQPE